MAALCENMNALSKYPPDVFRESNPSDVALRALHHDDLFPSRAVHQAV